MMNGMSLHPYPKGGLTGCQISISVGLVGRRAQRFEGAAEDFAPGMLCQAQICLPRSEHPVGEAMKKNKMDRQAADRRKSRLLKVELC